MTLRLEPAGRMMGIAPVSSATCELQIAHVPNLEVYFKIAASASSVVPPR
jgi:hypothetical protein